MIITVPAPLDFLGYWKISGVYIRIPSDDTWEYQDASCIEEPRIWEFRADGSFRELPAGILGGHLYHAHSQKLYLMYDPDRPWPMCVYRPEGFGPNELLLIREERDDDWDRYKLERIPAEWVGY